MPKEEHNKLLGEFLKEADNLPAHNGVRLFVSGSPLDNLQLYEIIEAGPATVVGEDHCWGNRSADVPIDTTLDPLEAIIDRYHFKPPCSRMFPMKRREEYCLSGVERAGAQGVIFYVFKHDGAEAWSIPGKAKVLKEKGVPDLILKNQPYLISEPEQVKADIDAFIKSVESGSEITA